MCYNPTREFVMILMYAPIISCSKAYIRISFFRGLVFSHWPFPSLVSVFHGYCDDIALYLIRYSFVIVAVFAFRIGFLLLTFDVIADILRFMSVIIILICWGPCAAISNSLDNNGTVILCVQM